MAAIVLAPLLLFFAAVMIVSMQISATHGFRSGWRAPAVFATIYLGQGTGLVWEYAFPSDAGKPRKVAPVVTVTQTAESLGEAERAA
jgi:H+/Cl- antiporter ClcA